MLKKKPSLGDLVRIRPTEDLVVVAQVIRVLQGNILLAVFSADESEGRTPTLMVETMDTRLKSGQWEIFGNEKMVELPEPLYIDSVGLEGQKWVQNFDGNLLRLATLDDVASYGTRKSFSPVAVEEAIKGINGVGEWRSAYDAMKIR
jgi:hypothetical protein